MSPDPCCKHDWSPKSKQKDSPTTHKTSLTGMAATTSKSHLEKTMSKYGMVDNGKRQSFGANRAIRDTADDKPRPDLISPFAEERQGHWLRMGAAKYAERNWERGMPFSRCVASLKRHLMKFQQGLQDEDHLAAIMFNAMALIHYEEMIERGVLPAELNDMPAYRVIKRVKKAHGMKARRPVTTQKTQGRKDAISHKS
jgi:hypothetical protein